MHIVSQYFFFLLAGILQLGVRGLNEMMAHVDRERVTEKARDTEHQLRALLVLTVDEM